MGGGKKVCAWLLANCEVQLCSALAAVSLLGVVVVCPVMLDPAIETLASSFDQAQCQTVYSQYLKGMSNCAWSSCREGCTADIYTCWHIVVVYMRDSEHEAYHAQHTHQHLHEHHLDATSSNNDNNGSTTGSMMVTTTAPPTGSTRWSMTPTYNFDRVVQRYDFSRNLTYGLSLFLEDIRTHLGNDSTAPYLQVGALYPNQQKCVYPSDTVCSEYYRRFGKIGGESFPCFVSRANGTMVVTTDDKLGAIRNIFYCLIPLIIAVTVFAYLFYRVGLIGNARGRLKSDDVESVGSSSKANLPGKNGHMPNGAPINAPKKVRKKFLPKRKDSSKKRRARKNLRKNASIKNQLSIKSASSSRRTPSISMAGISDDYVFSQPRTSVPKL